MRSEHMWIVSVCFNLWMSISGDAVQDPQTICPGLVFSLLVVGGFNPSAKQKSQARSFPQVGMNIQKIWNHQLAQHETNLPHRKGKGTSYSNMPLSGEYVSSLEGIFDVMYYFFFTALIHVGSIYMYTWNPSEVCVGLDKNSRLDYPQQHWEDDTDGFKTTSNNTTKTTSPARWAPYRTSYKIWGPYNSTYTCLK